MTASDEINRRAWQPFTPRGVAQFAHAPLRRLLVMQLIFALLAAATVGWFLDRAWFSTIRAAVRQLPPTGEIKSRRLDWPAGSPQVLATGPFLALVVDLSHSGQSRPPADVVVEFGRDNIRVFSLLGYLEFAYPDGWIIAFNQHELRPWWGAWEPPLLWMTAGASLVAIMLNWAVLAAVYSGLLWLVGFIANRELNLWSNWKLSGAALMPGALLMTLGIILYGLGVLGLVRFLVVAGVHFVVGWAYAIAGVLVTPRTQAATFAKGNPFRVPQKPPGDVAQPDPDDGPPSSPP